MAGAGSRCLWLSLVLLGACGGGSDPLDWRVTFGDGVERGRTHVVQVEIRRGGCGSSSVLYRDTVGQGFAQPADVPGLSPGVYGFAATAVDGECQAFAAGCAELQLPGPEMVAVELLGASARSVCSVCDDDCSDPPQPPITNDSGTPPPDTGSQGGFPCGAAQCVVGQDVCMEYTSGVARCLRLAEGCPINVISGGSCPCVADVCLDQRGCTISGDGTYRVSCGSPP